MSTDSDNKNGQMAGDWDSALEAWDESPLNPSLPDDKTPPPPGTEASESAGDAPATLKPPAGHLVSQEEDDDDECTVVGQVPAELLADSVRGLGGASGLSSLFSRGSQPTIPAEDEVAQQPASAPTSSSEPFSLRTLASRTDEANDADLSHSFDPFADLRDDLISPAPADATPVPAAVDTPLPGLQPNELDEPVSAGPKLLEPEDRKYPQDEVTEVFRGQGITVTSDSPATSRSEQLASADSAQESALVRSVSPPPLEPPKNPWPDERDASAHLMEREMRTEWEARAAWFAEEAAARDIGEQRARIMLAISELCAMVGDDEKAVAVAKAASDMDKDHPLLQRQTRYLANRERRWADVKNELETEARTAPTPEAKVHALLMDAHLNAQLHLDDDVSAKQIDLAARIVPSDPRPHLTKLIHYLNDETQEKEPPRWPDVPPLASLEQGAALVARIREAEKAPAEPGETVQAYEALPRAKAALRKGDTKAAARALRALDDVRGMGGGALWLAAALASQHQDSRPQAMNWLDKLATGPHHAVALRMLAMRAVESADRNALDRALAEPGSNAFSPADRVVLAALFQEKYGPVEPLVSTLLGQQNLAALGAAARSALTDVRDASRIDACSMGALPLRCLSAVGRAAALRLDSDEFWQRVAALRDSSFNGAVARLLELEMAIEKGFTDSIIDHIASWGGDHIRERDNALVAAIIAESLGDSERASQEYARVLSMEPSFEAAVRALRSMEPDLHANRVVELAARAEGAKGAAYALEAALLRGPGEDDYIDLLRLSHDKDPSLPYAASLAEQYARHRGDADGVIEWLRVRRETTNDPIEASLDACREALLMVERDTSLAVALMERACRARPKDAALRALYERFSEERPEDWIAWRLDRANESEGMEKAILLLEAALESERQAHVDDAAKLASQALDCGAGELALLCIERCELAGASTTHLTDLLMSQVRQEELPMEKRREVLEQLAELDEVGRGDMASALLWHRTILEQPPQHLLSLRRIEHAFIGMGRDGDLEPIASELVRALQGPEVDAHAVVASRIRLRESSWTDLADLARAAAQQPNPSLWALRSSFAHAREQGDDAIVVQTAKTLSGLSDNEIESAALLVHAAQALTRMDEQEEASQLFQMAIDREPGFFQAHLELVDVLEKTGEYARAAEELESLARKSNVDMHRAELWYRAAKMWIDKVQERERGRRAFEEASDIDIGYRDVFDNLRVLYTEEKDAAQLALLLERRLEATTDPQERVEIEVLRGKVLAEVGEIGGAKRALAAALEANPDHQPALEAFALTAAMEEDWGGAEQALLRLTRLVSNVQQQGEIYRKLGAIYLDHLPNLERGESCLREVLKRNPEDIQAQERLIDVFRATGDASKAIELGTQLVNQAQSPDAKREQTIRLALIHEQLEGNANKAQEILDRLYKQAPSAASPLRALAEFHRRQGHEKSLELLLDRASKDTARALRTGRFSPDLFATLETVASIRDDEAGAAVARAVVDVLEGTREVQLSSFGPSACSVNLDDILAPEVLTPALRALLKRAGDLFETAFPMDLKALRASAVPPSSTQMQEAIVAAASSMGVHNLQVFVSPALGPTCVPIQSNPPIVVLGSAMLTTDEHAVRDFLLIRALKIVQARGSVLARTAPIDLVPTVAALVKTLAPSFQPVTIDARRFAEATQKLSAAKPATVDPDMTALALEVGGALDNRASTLNIAINGWGDRAALLAQGGLSAPEKIE